MNFLNREGEREREVLNCCVGFMAVAIWGQKKKGGQWQMGAHPPTWALAWRGVWYDSCCVGGS